MSLVGVAEHAYYLFHRRGDVVALLKDGLSGLRADPRVLDLGGGTGRVSSALSRSLRGKFTVADADPRALARVAISAALEAVLLQAGADLPFGDASFDGILMVDVLHHVADPDHLLREAARCLRPSGRLVIVDFDANHRMTRVFGTLARLRGRRCRFRRPGDLAGDLRALGLLARAAPVDSLRYLVEGDR